MYLNYYEYESINRHISSIVCGPYKMLKRLEKTTKGVKWKVRVRYSDVFEERSGIVTHVELAAMSEKLKQQY